MKKAIKKLAEVGLAIIALAQPINAEQNRIDLGYNALETAVQASEGQDSQLRNRLLTNVEYNLGDAVIGYHGLNEVNNADSNTYFGRNVVTAGKKDVPTRFAAVTKANSNGIFDTKVGIRDTRIQDVLGGYGFTDITANGDAVGIDVLFGKPLPHGFSFEVYQSTTLPFEGEKNHYTELQLNKNLNDRFSIFGRSEIPNFNKNNANYLVGGTIKF